MRKKYILASTTIMFALSPVVIVIACGNSTSKDISAIENAKQEIIKETNFGPAGAIESSITVEQYTSHIVVTEPSEITSNVLSSLGINKTLPSASSLSGVALKYTTKKSDTDITFTIILTKGNAKSDLNYSIATPSLTNQDKVEEDIALFSNYSQLTTKDFETLNGHVRNDFWEFTQEDATALGFGTLPTTTHGSIITYKLTTIVEDPNWLQNAEDNFTFPETAVTATYELVFKATIVGTDSTNNATALSEKQTIKAISSFQEMFMQAILLQLDSSLTNEILYLPYGIIDEQINSELIWDAFDIRDEQMNPLEFLETLGADLSIVNIDKVAKKFAISATHSSFLNPVTTALYSYEVANLSKAVEMEKTRLYFKGWYGTPEVLPAGSVLVNGENLTSGTSFDIIKQHFELTNPLFNYYVSITEVQGNEAKVRIMVKAKADENIYGETPDMPIIIGVA